MEFYVVIVPPLIASLCLVWRLRHMGKHDKVLYEFCKIRREAMVLIREGNFTLSKDDYVALRAVAQATGETIHDFNMCKVSIFNLRNYVVQVHRVKSLEKKEVANPEIQKLHDAFGVAMLRAIFTFTPFVKSTLVLKLLKALASFGGRYVTTKVRRMDEVFAWVRHESEAQHSA